MKSKFTRNQQQTEEHPRLKYARRLFAELQESLEGEVVSLPFEQTRLKGIRDALAEAGASTTELAPAMRIETLKEIIDKAHKKAGFVQLQFSVGPATNTPSHPLR